MSASYTKSLSYSLGLHVFLFVILVLEISFNASKVTPISLSKSKNKEAQRSIQAFSVNEQALNNEMSQILEERQKKEEARIKEQQIYQRKLNALKESTKQREHQLAVLQKKQKIAEHQKQLALQRQQAELEQAEKRKRAITDSLKLVEKKLSNKKTHLSKLNKEIALKKEREAQEKKLAQQKVEQQRLAEISAKQKEAKLKSEVDKYKSLILTAISQNWIVPDATDLTLSCRFQVSLSSNGEVQNVNLVKGSGDPSLDRSARLAIFQSSPLPVPSDPNVLKLFKVINLTVTPKDLQKLS